MLSSLEQKILDTLEKRASSTRFEVVSVSVVGPKNSPILRVYIDADGGVSFDELSESSSWIGPVIEELDPFSGAYTLEVSSPGIDRPLVKLDDFERFSGSKAHIRMHHPVSERRNFNGELCGVDGEDVLIDVEGEKFRLDFNDMSRANLIGSI